MKDMIRREFLKVGAVTAAGLLTAAKPVRSAAAALQRNESQPNILWITCEDMSPRLGCYGDRTVPTPNIDRLAREGVRYTRAFATTGVCAPSRHALITGMYPTSTYALQMRNLSRTSALKEIKDPATRAFAATRPLYEAVPPAGKTLGLCHAPGSPQRPSIRLPFRTPGLRPVERVSLKATIKGGSGSAAATPFHSNRPGRDR